jgi:prepilin-type N-terminal cleavage/methylation domain-containing protein
MNIKHFQQSGMPAGGINERGFTLLELLISMTLFLLVVVILGGAMRLSLRSVAAAEKKMDAIDRYRTSFGIVTAQLQSSAPLTYDDEGTRRYYLKGDSANLQFATNYSIRGGERGCVIVSYRLEPGYGGRLSLYASERAAGMETDQEIRLFDDLEVLSFSYFGREAGEEDGKWTEEWPDDTRYPEQLKVNLSRNGGEAKILAPLYARMKKGPS